MNAKSTFFRRYFFIGLRGHLRQIAGKIKTQIRIARGKERNIEFVPPNYLFLNTLDKQSIIVDVGCGFDADFSVFMMNRFGLKAMGLDPTEKHRQSLEQLSEKMDGRFRHVVLAVSAKNGRIAFNESVDNVSGSILAEHKNVRRDKIKTYEVDSTDLASLPTRLGLSRVEYIKLDLEGAEYDIVNNLEKDDLKKYDQIFIEFHHHCVPTFSEKDTETAVRKIEDFGFQSYTVDSKNYLFYK